jgi:sugar/nucleoside kinase (ribokinase family)
VARDDFDVVVVGNVGVDTNVYLAGPAIDFAVEANFTENLDCVGQAGGFASIGFARMGLRTAFVGYVGDDMLGAYVRDVLEAHGVDCSCLFVDPAGTSRSVNVMFAGGERKNFYDGKGHMTLRPDVARCRRVLERSRLAHFNIPNWARTLLPAARASGATISCDLQDVVTFDDAYRKDFLEAADVLFFSAANLDDPAAVVADLVAAEPRRVCVVGCGARGCIAGSAAGVVSAPPVELAEPVVDSNGAGDSLAVGFLTSYVLDGYGLKDAVLRGQIAARHACTLRSAPEGLITRAQLDLCFAEISS